MPAHSSGSPRINWFKSASFLNRIGRLTDDAHLSVPLNHQQEIFGALAVASAAA